MIIKTHGKFKVISKVSHRNLGTYKTKSQAIAREKQVNYFKHLKK